MRGGERGKRLRERGNWRRATTWPKGRGRTSKTLGTFLSFSVSLVVGAADVDDGCSPVPLVEVFDASGGRGPGPPTPGGRGPGPPTPGDAGGSGEVTVEALCWGS